MSPKYKLYGFTNAGWAEPIRFILSYGNIEFEDIRISLSDWKEWKEKMPFGFLPVLEFEGKKIGESIAIARYLAKESNLRGNDDWEDFEIDSIVDSIKDLVAKLPQLRRETDDKKRQKMIDELTQKTFPFYLTRFEEVVAKTGYLALGRITWVDIYFVSLVKPIDYILKSDILKDFPSLESLNKKIYELPNIKKWLEIRPKAPY